MFEIGPALRQARDRRRLGLDQAEAETKVRARYLRALEEEDFDLLPGPTYVKGFLRTYADYLGLDGRLFVEEYTCRFVEPGREDELLFPRARTLAHRPRRSSRDRNVILVALVGILAVAVLVVIGWKFSPAPTPTPDASPRTTTARATGRTVNVNPLLSGAAINRRRSRQAAAPVPGRRPVRLVARARALCWTQIWSGRDRLRPPIVARTLDPGAADGGSTPVLRSRAGFTVQVGAVGNLELVVNGVPQVLGSGSTFYVSPTGRVTPA